MYLCQVCCHASRFERFSFVLAPENCDRRQDGTEKKKRDGSICKEETES